MGFLAYWPLAFLILVPVIILLYILKQEAKQKTISSTMLWQEAYRNIEATKPWERLKKNILLFLQIITVLLFVLAMMGPWIHSLASASEQVILVIDNSASMETLYEDNETRLEAAKKAACDYVDRMPLHATIHVIAVNQQSVLVLSNSTDKLEAKQRISSIEQTKLSGTPATSLGLVQSCASQSEEAQIVFFTDTAFDLGNMEATVASFYSEGENISLDTVNYSWKNDALVVLAQLTNHGTTDAKREVNLYGIDASGKEELLTISETTVDAGTSSSVYMQMDKALVQEVCSLRAEINESDALIADNTAWCVLEEIKTNRVLLVTQSNLFMEKAISNLSGMDVYRTSDASVVNGAEQYDLYIFDGIVPQTLPPAGSFLFINCEYDTYFSRESDVQGIRLVLQDTPITSYIDGKEIGVNEAGTYQLPSWAESYVKADNSCAGFFGVYDGHRIVTLGFDLHQTDFCLQAEFPVLVANMADYLLNGSLIDKSAYVVGESVVLHGSTRGDALTLVTPDGKQQQLEASEASGSYVQLNQMGIYHISQKVEEITKEQSFVAGFPVVSESSVTSAAQMIAEDEQATELEKKSGILEVRKYILIILLILMCVEWGIYLRLK